jgi:hypothetical protein
MFAVKNVSTNRKLVCTLADKTTLRLFPGQSVSLKDSQVTPYLEQLSQSKIRIVVLEHSPDKKAEKKQPTKTATKAEENDKEE